MRYPNIVALRSSRARTLATLESKLADVQVKVSPEDSVARALQMLKK